MCLFFGEQECRWDRGWLISHVACKLRGGRLRAHQRRVDRNSSHHTAGCCESPALNARGLSFQFAALRQRGGERERAPCRCCGESATGRSNSRPTSMGLRISYSGASLKAFPVSPEAACNHAFPRHLPWSIVSYHRCVGRQSLRAKDERLCV